MEAEKGRPWRADAPPLWKAAVSLLFLAYSTLGKLND